MSSPAGKYELLSDPADRAWDDFLIAVGMSDAHREALMMVKPTVEITVADGTWTLKILSELANQESVFTLGEKVTTRLDGANPGGTSVFTQPADNKLVESFTVGGIQGQVTRDFSADGLTTTFSCGGKAAVRKYKRV
ncbi:lipocalin/fatty-acid binding family protein [Streptomyces cyaneofuscatus]|uniref:lipocalin/fatty-acid binding family protein n=1 Tax=Streptomyces cyaneofuscatus TaxID=66883 RepID=UPI002FEFC0FA